MIKRLSILMLGLILSACALPSSKMGLDGLRDRKEQGQPLIIPVDGLSAEAGPWRMFVYPSGL